MGRKTEGRVRKRCSGYLLGIAEENAFIAILYFKQLRRKIN
jgi:hypothetical protein